MIVGVILRNFKNFRNQHYIPLTINGNSSWLIGENGVGKSSILQAIDTVLNRSDINKLDINNDARSQGFDTREPFIVPIFLIRKENVKSNNSNFRALEAISDITWQVESDDFNSSQRALAEKFINHRSYLESQYRARDYFLIPIGVIKKAAGDVPMPFMSIFESIDDYKNEIDDLSSESTTTNSLQRKNTFQITLYKILEYMRENYNFIYLPAEITTSEYSKIESELLQSLLGENLQQKISRIIKKKDITDINKYLNEFVEQLSIKLNGKYHFKKPTQRQNSFTQRHMIAKIIESYFSDKILHYIDNINRDIPVHNLSSGEKRKALLDLSIGFLKGNPKKSQQSTILAVDEPELSLHATSCFKQFEKIRKISELGIQTICTTHWYGFLPAAMNGSATYVSPNQTFIKCINLEYYREELSALVKESRGSYLDTLEVKSNHDLVQSIITSITSSNNYNWILCEGKTDKKYIESHLEFEDLDEKNLIILSVGGSFALKDIYSYLVLALKDRRPAIKGKVFCLLDTDLAYDKFESVDSIPQIRIRRLLLREDLTDVDLLKTTDNKLSPPTEIEDALDGLFFYETIHRIYKNGDNRFSFIENVEILCSNVAAGIMDLTTSQKQIIKNYFDEPGKKNFFCDQYLDVLYESDEVHTPTWLNDIVDFFIE
ncbi:AAA family ATPase [Cronobacter dublinensis]|uniref:AAA family ATPase n=1 Tax=Cronobacter dublinensis TaxID=413497 RepID=UPI000CFDC1AB|nr:AAA family ATPase [Cronobacter dublinensis]MDT3604956.1 AAA family ATPase [Cronobacter dublinensis]